MYADISARIEIVAQNYSRIEYAPSDSSGLHGCLERRGRGFNSSCDISFSCMEETAVLWLGSGPLSLSNKVQGCVIICVTY